MLDLPRIVVADFISGSLEPERAILGGLADIVSLEAASEDDLIGNVEDATAIMMYHVIRLSEKTLSRLNNCRVIVRCGVGVDNIDRQFARQRNIPVCNVPDYGTEEVADSAIGMLLALARGITLANSLTRSKAGEWSYTEVAPLRRLRGQVLGIVGLGRIGTAAAQRGKALGMDVVFYDPYLPDGWDKALGVRRAESLEELLGQSYAVSLHCPLTPETRHLIDARALSLLPRGSFLINTSRGAVVETAAIPEAIASGRLAGAGIDVLEIEPPGPDDPLITAWRDPTHPAHHRVLINPHSAFYSEEGLRDMRVKGSETCRRALLGLPLRNVVN
jgi:D-3-phosphoglycerate dehydrogenase/C-terminal binding protein